VFTGNKVANIAFQVAEVRNRLRIARWLKSPSKKDSLLLIRSWPEAARQRHNPRGFQAWAMAIEGQTAAFNLPPTRLQPPTNTPKR
jgi:antibiotic biosynthesis monooxygenase (ABM) superfamily enzyme